MNMVQDNFHQALVIDNGTGTCKVGFAGGCAPDILFPSSLGRLGRQSKEDTRFVGGKVPSKGIVRCLEPPIERGIVTNWDDMERIWHHIFRNELGVLPEEYPVLLAEPPISISDSTRLKASRDRMSEIMFEKFGVPALHINVQAVLSLYASGRATGCVLDSGHGVTHTVPIFEGYTIPHAISRLEIAGDDLTRNLASVLVQSRVFSSMSTAQVETNACRIKEDITYVSENFDQEMKTLIKFPSLMKERYKLPDGRTVFVGKERFHCPEALFQPTLIGMDSSLGIHDCTFQSITKCDRNIWSMLYSNVILSGGTTMVSGIGQRMTKELASLATPGTKIKVVSPPGRSVSAWVGGSVLGSLSTFQRLCVSKAEYEEIGPSAIHRKCF